MIRLGENCQIGLLAPVLSAIRVVSVSRANFDDNRYDALHPRVAVKDCVYPFDEGVVGVVDREIEREGEVDVVGSTNVPTS